MRLPAGYQAALPEDASGESPQGRWALRYSQGAGAVKGTLDLELRGGLLPPADYQSLRELLGRFDQAVGRPVVAAAGPSAALEGGGR